jgi:hypothetical protein
VFFTVIGGNIKIKHPAAVIPFLFNAAAYYINTFGNPVSYKNKDHRVICLPALFHIIPLFVYRQGILIGKLLE